ncbi:S41 family peptidase, partial [Longispora fulva]|uniref:S41 family peptidase n=2 Tax=Bacteria TaxID=2 RepID=UPI00363DDD6A
YDLVSDQDRFSLIIDNYERLENLLVGIDESNGMNYGLGRISGTNDRFGFIRYVLPGTSAEAQGLKRGDIFTEVNGVQISDSNYRDLLFSGESYTINVGRIVNGNIEMTEQTVSLTGQEYSENPIFTTNVIQREGRTIGYLKYNGFYGTPEYDTQLNAVFGDFKAQGVTDLVLDLRYNGGGYVETAIDLASMITGQFEGQVALREQWNEKYQNAWPEESYITRFDNRIRTGEQINSLNLSQVYVLAT